MSNSPIDAVLAGTKPFAVALLAPLTTRVGVRPRIVADAAQALALSAPGALVVIEFSGPEALPGIEQLAKAGGRRVVAGVAAAQAASEPALRALGVEIARWDGRPDAVLDAVARRAGAAAPAATAPVAAPAKPSAAAPAPAPKVPTPAAVKPAAPATKPAAQAAPAPAKPAAPAVAPVAVKPAAPAAAAVAKPPAPAPAAKPAAPAAAAPPASRPAPAFFADLTDELDDSPLDVDVSEAFDLVAPPAAAAPPPAAQPAPRAAATTATPATGEDWPGGLPTETEAGAALEGALAGAGPGAHGAATDAVVGALTELERAVLQGDAVPVDAAPIRRAATMRLRVAVALATRPPAGSSVDTAAVQGLLGAIDALLSEIALVAGGAPPEVAPALEAIRNELVREAIDFSEAAQALQPAGAPAQPAAAPVASRRAAGARVLSVSQGEVTEPADRRSTAMWIVLAVIVLAGGGYHGWQYLDRKPHTTAAAATNAPTGTMGTAKAGAPKVITTLPGQKVDPAELERLRAAEQAKGNRVRELVPGTWVVEPETRGSP